MKRSHLTLAAALLVSAIAAGPARAATLCVDHRAGCFDALAPAVGAARDGDTIRIGPGAYRGGVTIDASIELRGAGAGRTRIHGGGPVLTIGAPFAPDPPTVSISDVTISGGVTTTTEWDTHAAYFAFGGGVYIPPAEGGEPGATVTIGRSVIAHNLAAPSVAVSPGGNEGCPECPFAIAFGGGVFNAGDLTLTRTTVSHNRVGGPVTSVPEGGGIFSPGSLTVDRSDVVANEAIGQPPNGRGAAAGGIWASETGFTVRHSSISDNRAVLESHWPIGDSPGAIGGGLLVQGDFTLHPGVRATIDHSKIAGNETRAFNPIGDATAFSGGVHGNGAVAITDSEVSRNRAIAVIPPDSTAKAAADSAAGNLNVGALISRVRFYRNTVLAEAAGGTAIGGAGALWAFADDPLDVRDSAFTGNRVTAIGHDVDAFGAGIVNTDVLTLHGTDISRNTLLARGATGDAQGGGIWNGRRPDSQDLAPILSASDSTVTYNAIIATPGLAARGGGLFTSEPVALQRVHFRANRPDDTSTTQASRTAAPDAARSARRPRRTVWMTPWSP
jgi:hypothetical protein